jgi:O-antigen/teichoic acid export membrane protein
VSGAIFASAILVARSESATAFGVYVLAFTTLLITSGLQGALVTQPHNVIGATQSGAAYVRYTTATALSQLLFIALTSAIALGAALVALFLDLAPAGLFVALAAANLGFQLLEFCRRVLYTEGRVRTACGIDLLGWGAYLAVLGVLAVMDDLTSVSAVAVLLPALGCAALLGAYRIRDSLGRSIDASAVRRNWTFGKWLAASRIAYWLSSYFYFYLAAFLLGASASGMLRVAQLLFGPLNVFLLTLDTLLPIALARVRHQSGLAGLRQAVRRVFLTLSMPVLAYCVFVALFATSLLSLVFGPRYTESTDLVLLFSVLYVLQYCSQVVSAAYSAQLLTRAVFVAMSGAAAVAVVLGIPLVEILDIDGAVVGMMIGQLVFLVLAGILWRRIAPNQARAVAPEFSTSASKAPE